MKFLLVEDQNKFIEFLQPHLEVHGTVVIKNSYKDAKKALNSESFDCAIFDILLGDDVAGLDLIKLAKKKATKYIMALSNYSDNKDIVRKAYINGANDFIPKAKMKSNVTQFIKKMVNRDSLKTKIERLCETKYLITDVEFRDDLYNTCNTYNPNLPIFIKGESGSGKTELAKCCLKPLLNPFGNFVNINCAGLNIETLKSELFGHKKGAFTGAITDKVGKIELADNGILFLDEIGDAPLEVQRMILKVIEEKEFTRLGCNILRKSNFILVTASLKPLNKLVKNGLMREDFYNRIMGKIIHIKPLRERPDDLSNLIDHFFDKASRTVFLSDDAKNELLKYDWRGNIRELKRVIINLTDKDDGIVNLVDIKKIFELIKLDEDDTFGNSQEIHKDSLLTHKIIDEARNLTYQGMLKRLQSEFYDLALYQSNGKAVTIQKTFGIARGSIYNHMKSKDINMEVLQ